MLKSRVETGSLQDAQQVWVKCKTWRWRKLDLDRVRGMEWQKETGNIDETTESEKTRDFGILLSRFVRFFFAFVFSFCSGLFGATRWQGQRDCWCSMLETSGIFRWIVWMLVICHFDSMISQSTSWSNRFIKFTEDRHGPFFQSSCTGEMHAFAQEHVHLWAYSALLLVQTSGHNLRHLNIFKQTFRQE